MGEKGQKEGKRFWCLDADNKSPNSYTIGGGRTGCHVELMGEWSFVENVGMYNPFLKILSGKLRLYRCGRVALHIGNIQMGGLGVGWLLLSSLSVEIVNLLRQKMSVSGKKFCKKLLWRVCKDLEVCRKFRLGSVGLRFFICLDVGKVSE
ncbi:hypothetical protein TNCV_3147211 [Trichonephila clavipes]|nr:hypothetical protein TNCV_3147211 [Trichonephila clavipes]